MSDQIKKYFQGTSNTKDIYNDPATDEQISAVESKLNIKFPEDYKDFLKYTNGFEGDVGAFVAILDPVEEIYQSTQQTCAEFFSGMIYIGTNGGGEMFVIDTRAIPFQFGLLPNISSIHDFIPLGDTFEKFIIRLYDDTAFDRTLPL
jgi:cell wall assembly regulator SMI1